MQKKENINILYIDDEQNNLNSFKASFRRDFKVFTAISAEEGREVLRTENIHVIFADQRMPDETGVQFFESILEKYPEPVRILLTGYSDIEAVIAAINKGRVFRYLTKPWQDNELFEAIDHAYQAYKLREQKNESSHFFFYKVAHDLRGPINSVRSLVDISSQELDKKEEVKKYLSLIKATTKSMDDTLVDLVDFQKIDDTGISYSHIHFQEQIDKILESLHYQEGYEETQFHVEVHQPGGFRSDEGVIHSVLLNLIQNAIKYRDKTKSPEVNINVTAGQDNALIEISDNGMGISEPMKDKVFKMFFRANNNTTGSGLGLYIVQTGVKKLGGTITLESTSGEGTTINVVLPNSKNNIMRRKDVI